MAGFVEVANELAVQWGDGMWAAVWQSTILAALVLLLTWALRRASSALRFWLWMLVPLRLLVMPLLVVPLPLLSPPEEPSANEAIVEEAPDTPVFLSSAEAMDANVADHSADMASTPTLTTTPGASAAAAWPRPAAWLMGAWATGILLSAFRLACCWRKVQRILARSETVRDGPVLASARRAAAMAGLRDTPRVVVTQDTVSPFTCGIVRPVVVLPAAFLQVVDKGGLLAVLTHEFVHLRRRDLPLGVLLALCEILYFFHPVVHAVRRMVLRERERACDEAVLATSREKPSTYAKALVGAAELCSKLHCARPSASVATESFSDLRVRLLAITANLKPASGLSVKGLLLIVALAFFCVPGVSVTARKAETAPEKPVSTAVPAVPHAATGQSEGESGAKPETPRSPSSEQRIRSTSVKGRAAAITGAENAVTSGESANARVLHFPPGRSFGTLRVLYPGTSRVDYPFGWYNHDEMDWLYHAEAKGDVAVPRGKRIRLDISTSAALDLSPLADLAPDDLDMLSMNYNPVDDQAMVYVEKLSGLRRLDLTSTDITDKGLAYLMDLTKLERLVLPSGITTEGLAMLTSLHALESLALHKTELTPIGAGLLSELGALEFLTLRQCDLSRTDLFNLSRLRNLKQLFFASCEMGDYHLRQVSDIASLEILDLRGCNITDAGIRYLQPLQKLESLNVSQTAATDKGLAQLKQFPRLRKLNLSYVEMTDEGARHLSEIKTLEYLRAPNHGITDIGLGYLGELSNLKYLWVCCSSNSPLSDAGLLQFARLQSLESLYVGGAGITDAGLVHLAQLPSLTGLHLSFMGPVTNEGLKHLATLSTLQDLSLSFLDDPIVSVAGVNHLNALTDLRKLTLRCIVQDGAGLDLSNLTQLEWFIVNFVDGPGRDATPSLRDDDLAWVSNAPNLTWLMAGYGVNFSDTGMAHVAGMEHLERLSLGGDLVSNNGLSYLGGMPALQDLYLWGNITDPGLRHLEGLPRLRHLDIHTGRDFSDEARSQLAAALPNLMRFNAPSKARGGGARAGYGGARGGR